jgi:uncharacterized surface protein with fasciclin (FAS1) repeats
MTMKSSILVGTVAFAAALSFSSLHAGSCGAGAKTAKASKGSGDYAACSSDAKSIVSVASEAGQFKTLVAAIQAAGLAETLQGDGPFTVFAPTDEAFAKLPAGTVENLLKPENRDKLVAILTYHVVPGRVMAADVTTSKAATVNGQKLDIKVDGGQVTVDGARVVATDVAAGNGVIHVIDTVVLPM